MRNLAIALLSAAAFTATVTACSEKTDKQAQEAANAARSDFKAAADRAGTAAARATDELSAAATRIGHRIDKAADRAGDTIDNSAAEAKNATGAALERAGHDIRH